MFKRDITPRTKFVFAYLCAYLAFILCLVGLAFILGATWPHKNAALEGVFSFWHQHRLYAARPILMASLVLPVALLFFASDRLESSARFALGEMWDATEEGQGLFQQRLVAWRAYARGQQEVATDLLVAEPSANDAAMAIEHYWQRDADLRKRRDEAVGQALADESLGYARYVRTFKPTFFRQAQLILLSIALALAYVLVLL